MADSAVASSQDAPDGETATQRQARLRREKRQKKMTEQGEDRLARIKALNGGVAPPDEVLGGPQAANHADDPDEVDISQNASGFGTPTLSNRHIDAKEDPLAAAILQMQKEQNQNQRLQDMQGSTGEDPMVRMMEQMMSLMGGLNANVQQGANATPQDLPPMLKAMMGGGAGAGQEQAQPTPSNEYLWKIVHAVFAFSLALYFALGSTFNGTKLARSQSVLMADYSEGYQQRLFLVFCTVELVLQSTRYFLEKGQLQGTGMLAQVVNSGVIPEPWAGYVRSLGRYVGIAQTIFTDVMMVVFVFGALAWWQGSTIS